MRLDPLAGLPTRKVVAHALTFWRRSIQARVVASTVLLAAIVVGIVGVFLLQQTRDGLLEQREQAVVGEATRVTVEARERLARVPSTETDVDLQLRELVDPIVQLGRTRDFAVVLGGPAGESRISDSAKYTPRLDKTSVPSDLERHFDTAAGTAAGTAYTYTEVRRTNADGEVVGVPGIVVGSQVRLPADSKTYTLYFLFPLDDEIGTLQLVSRALLTAAGLLLLLVAGLTWLVTRQVVTPVRMARRVAERLAAGELQERLPVKGEDDLARLAISFNQMATSLQRQIRQLEELSRVQRRFVSDVSHELRTPLTTVRMAGEMLHDARGDFDPATARAAELLQSELDRFETLLVDLLEISRFDAGAAVLEIDDIDLVVLVRRIVDATSALATQNGVEIFVEADGPCRAEADVRRVERIVRNLVTNAIDHAESGDIVIRLAGDDHAAAIAVRDHGVGLGVGEAAMVFNRFWRADPARARTSGGTGLGLSIAMEDTHLHGGWLQAWGRPGEGAQFRLTLPRRNGGVLRRSPLPLVPADPTAVAR